MRHRNRVPMPATRNMIVVRRGRSATHRTLYIALATAIGCGGAQSQVLGLTNSGTGVLGTGVTIGTVAPGGGIIGTGLTVNTTGAGGVAGTGVTIGTTDPGTGVLGTGVTIGTGGTGTVGTGGTGTVGTGGTGTVGTDVGATVGTVGGTVAGTVGGTVAGTVGSTVGSTVGNTVGGTVGGTAGSTVGGTVGGTVAGTVAGTAATATVAIGDLTNLALRLNTSPTDGAVAVGVNAGATASGSIAIGRSATANQPNSVAIGSNVSTTRTDQVVIGNTNNPYPRTGVASPASRAAQSGPTQFVTTDAAGNLGTSTYGPASIAALDNRVGSLETNVARLQRDMRGAYQGTAIALALTGAVLPADKNFAVSANFGAYHGETGFGASGVARVSDNVFVSGGIGVGTSGQANVAGRGGVTVAW